MMSEPEQLLQAARAGDAPPWANCWSYIGAIRHCWCVQIGQRLQQKVDASDIVQETFLKVHRNFPNFRGTTEAEFAVTALQDSGGQPGRSDAALSRCPGA